MRKSIQSLALLAALSAGVFAASPARADGDCCKPGTPCCKPGSPCCKK